MRGAQPLRIILPSDTARSLLDDVHPLQSFTVESLINLQRTLFSSREPRLQETYESTVDNRRLSAVGVFTDKLEEPRIYLKLKNQTSN